MGRCDSPHEDDLKPCLVQVGGGAYYNRCSKMAWTGNLFENNTARSGSAGMELNQCSGDIRQSSFFKNRVNFPNRPEMTLHTQSDVQEIGM